jgi:hypothetical protein
MGCLNRRGFLSWHTAPTRPYGGWQVNPLFIGHADNHQIEVHERYRKQINGKALFKEMKNFAVRESIEHMELDS